MAELVVTNRPDADFSSQAAHDRLAVALDEGLRS